MEHIVGLDLGTTNSLIACADDAGPRVIADVATGRKSIPSIVSFLRMTGLLLAGRLAS